MPDVTIADQSAMTPPPAQTTSSDAVATEIEQLQSRAGQLELRLNDLGVKTTQLADARDRATTADRPTLEKQWADAQHQEAAVRIELAATKSKIDRLEDTQRIEQTRQMMRAGTIQPPPDNVFPNSEQLMQITAGGMLLMFPLVLALARRLWVRRVQGTQVLDIESSPRLERMEQAIEAIAVEVERIGEAQRFTMKVLSDRPAVVPIPLPKREVESVTPH